jgi:hypothetical protein
VAAFFNKNGRALARVVANELQRNPSLRGSYCSPVMTLPNESR